MIVWFKGDEDAKVVRDLARSCSIEGNFVSWVIPLFQLHQEGMASLNRREAASYPIIQREPDVYRNLQLLLKLMGIGVRELHVFQRTLHQESGSAMVTLGRYRRSNLQSILPEDLQHTVVIEPDNAEE